LFGIATPGQLGSRQQMRDSYEIFRNTYVHYKQMQIEGIFNMLGQYAGVTEELKLQPVDPIGIDFSESVIKEVAPKEWILEKLGIDPTKYGLPIETEQPMAASPLNVNEHIKGLKGREWQNMQRIIRDYNKGKITREQASSMLKGGYALSDDEVATWLGAEELEFSEDDYKIFYEFGEDREQFEIFKSKKRFSDDDDYQAFADVNQLEANVLDQISKQKNITPEVLSEVLQVTIPEILAILKSLEDRKLLVAISKKIGRGDDSNVIVERELVKPLSKIVGEVKPSTSEMLIRYSYEWISGFSDANIGTSRPFCVHLLKAKKMYSRSEIESMSSRLGYSVWNRGGGWWNDNGRISPSCRHEWKTNVVKRKK
jgi:DNA-binding MarR family transcriptional regulator